ncbi:NAD(P)-dependent oxidoreductase [Lactobacillus delbrueckii subsp. bulgaricus]|nr:hypothetical protein [Lactobacillus delbrueckii subsp. bulgaricus]MBT8921409.1 hypothetical protein [Lactobacillus delbrueckii subsp. bulgaricus]
MKKIDAHLHLVRDLASYKGNGRSNALGNGLVVWDSGFKTRLFPAGWGDDAFRADAARKVMEDHDVAKAVFLQGSLYGFQNYYSWQVAKSAPDHFAPAFSIDPFASEAEKIVKRHVEDLGFRALKLEVSQADYVSLNAPATAETYHVIDEAALSMMQPTAFLINTSRGSQVDEAALLRALKGKRIAGAGLDVFEEEPDFNKEFCQLDNVILTPHAGSATRESRRSVLKEASHNIVSFLVDGVPVNRVN